MMVELGINDIKNLKANFVLWAATLPPEAQRQPIAGGLSVLQLATEMFKGTETGKVVFDTHTRSDLMMENGIEGVDMLYREETQENVFLPLNPSEQAILNSNRPR